jgi:hypothetical protein
MTPTRRTILVATACGLTTGCVASTLNDENDPPDERELTSVTTSVPDDAPFAWEATVLQRRINSDQTAEFELRVTWQGEETVEYRFGSTIPLGDPKYSEEPDGLILIANDHPRQNDRTWLPKTGGDGHVDGSNAMRYRELSPGEAAGGTVSVWGDPQEVSHVEPGTYRFEEKTTPVRGGDTYTWEFTTTIEER